MIKEIKNGSDEKVKKTKRLFTLAESCSSKLKKKNHIFNKEEGLTTR